MRKYFSYSSVRILRKICVPLILILVVIQVAVSCAPKNLVSQPDTARSLNTPSAYPIVDPSQNSTSFEFNQGAAMLPASQNDLAGLSNAPRYNIDLRINFEERSFEGRSQVDYTNIEDVDLNILYFRLLPNGGRSYGSGSLTVNRVLVDGEPVQSQLSEHETVLAVPLTVNLSPSDSVQITFDFVGQVPDVGRDGEDSNGYGIFSYNQDVMALAGWYPILAVYDEDGWNLDPVSSIGDSVYSDIAFYNLHLTAPGDLVVVTTGIEVSREDTADAVNAQFVSGPVRDFFLIMSPEYQVETSSVNGTEINSYHLPGHARANSDALSIARDSLDIYNQQFGHYPYRELDVVEAPLRGISGVEFPGIILVRSGYYNNTDDPVFTVVLAHEVAHQWWYNVVGNDVFDDPWLDEALTTYASSLYYEFVHGKSATKGITDYWQANYKGAVDRGHDEQITQNLAYFENLSDRSVYGRIVYSKGALFFKALREEIGDEAFFQALKDYYASYRYQIAKPEHLLTLFEETAGRSLANFYQDWLFTP